MDEAERLARRDYAREWRKKHLERERKRVRIDAAERRARDREGYNAAMREYRRLHPDQIKEYQRRAYEKADRIKRNAYMRVWYQKNKERLALVLLTRRYNVTLEELQVLIEKHDGKCAICHQPPTGKTAADNVKALHLDHDHKTGRVRGFLCNPCNRMIGDARDSPARLRAAAAYLESA